MTNPQPCNHRQSCSVMLGLVTRSSLKTVSRPAFQLLVLRPKVLVLHALGLTCEFLPCGLWSQLGIDVGPTILLTYYNPACT